MPDIVYLNNHTAKIKPHESWELWFKWSVPVCYPHVNRMSTHDLGVVFRAQYGHRRPQKYGAYNQAYPPQNNSTNTFGDQAYLTSQSHALRTIVADMITKKAPSSTVKRLTTGQYDDKYHLLQSDWRGCSKLFKCGN